jgi:hypothetical protein
MESDIIKGLLSAKHTISILIKMVCLVHTELLCSALSAVREVDHAPSFLTVITELLISSNMLSPSFNLRSLTTWEGMAIIKLFPTLRSFNLISISYRYPMDILKYGGMPKDIHWKTIAFGAREVGKEGSN